MPRTVNIAAIQMDALPAPLEERLARAERLIAEAAKAGAQLVVLPELFNTGYAYDETNFERAEPLDGTTVEWMRQIAAHWEIHLAGSLMIWDGRRIFNSLLLYAPDGRLWRYDKRYPWGWERGYFRPGGGIRIADTDLGKIGFLVCWDSGHTNLWRQYAGQVDLMVICSCPPDVSDPRFRFPNGNEVGLEGLGPIGRQLKGSTRTVFGRMIAEQTAWLGVPSVNTVGSGLFRTGIPNSRVILLAMTPFSPGLARYLPQADEMEMVCQMTPGTQVIAGDGLVVAEAGQEAGETLILGEVSLPGADHPKPQKSTQPPTPLPTVTYLMSDWLLPLLTLGTYRQGVLKRARNENVLQLPGERRMVWPVILLGLGLLAAAVGWLWVRRRN